jgi:putative transposase
MFVTGTSTHKVGEVVQKLMGVTPSAIAVSRLNQSLTQQFEAWRERSLQLHWRVVYLDGIHFKIRHGGRCDTSIILTADGELIWKEVLAMRVCAEEDKAGWVSQTRKICAREEPPRWISWSPMDMMDCSPLSQRCLVHKQRNVLAAIPRRERGGNRPKGCLTHIVTLPCKNSC